MNEFIENLIGRLEEINPVDYGSIGSYEAHSAVKDCLRDVKKIVKQLAEEHKGGCEWELADAEMNLYYTECGNAYIFAYGNPKENNYKFCPYCGKEIKVVQ